MKSFLIIDDHEVVRQGLKLLINDFCPGVQIFEAKDGKTAEFLLKNHEFTLVILDLQIPDTNSFELLDYIVNIHPQTRILIFSMSPELLYGQRVISAGAHGYLSKDSSMEDVRKAIDTILSNRKYISEQLLDTILKEPKTEQVNPFTKLSQREFEIATFLLAGLTVTEIAERVHLQPSTVGTYKFRIFEKLQVSNLLQLKELANIYKFS